MRLQATCLGLIICVAQLSAAPAFTQTLESTSETTTPATVANVYIQTLKGVDVYTAASTGRLTLVKGSPFPDSGQMEGVNGKYLISVGTTNLHTYAIEPDGAVGKQASVINTQDYSGSECGTTSDDNNDPNGAILDHTGKYFYVQLYGATVDYYFCDAWQAYEINSNGELLFLNDAVENSDYVANPYIGTVPTHIPTISSNDKFAYSGDNLPNHGLAPFTLPSGFVEINNGFAETGPSMGSWALVDSITAKSDPANHLAVLLYFGDGQGHSSPAELASYSINNANGDIVSTNTLENMPTPGVTNIRDLSMSTSGKLLAVYGNPGLQLFHFNAAAPITHYSSVLLPTVAIDQVAWDNSNHLYALSYSTQELYVYTATPTSITAVAGSPFSVHNAYGIKGLIVVPK